MILNDWLTLIAVFLSPIVAVVITLFYQKRDEKRKQKIYLYMTMLTFRRSIPLSQRFIDAVNTIDVVFHNKPKVIKAWKDLYMAYHTEPFQQKIADHRLLDLLYEMGKSLGYKKVKQTDLDSFYFPAQSANQVLYQEELNAEWMRILKNSHSFGKSNPPKEGDK